MQLSLQPLLSWQHYYYIQAVLLMVVASRLHCCSLFVVIFPMLTVLHQM